MPVEQLVQSETGLDDVRVVAVDSRHERRQVMRQLLERTFEPGEIAEADSRPAAVELVGRCHPDLVVVEIQMPLQEGLDTITEIAGMTPRPRIVVCSFHKDPATVKAARELGADAYVAKPAGSAELRAALGAPLPERPVRHRPPNERPTSPSYTSEGRPGTGGSGASFPSMIA
jgi:DNA-binding NarL/FixJ family response regulator